MSDDEYFARRAEEELAAANRAACPEAKRAHIHLANSYLLKIEKRPFGVGFASPDIEGPSQA